MGISNHWILWICRFLAGVSVLITVDALIGLGYRNSEDAVVTVIAARSGTTRRAIVAFPGYVMSGETLGGAFAPYVADDDAIVAVSYAESGVDVSQICEAVMTALNQLRPPELLVYGPSMGGMVSVLFLEWYRRAGTPYGMATLILDSAPANRENIKRPSFLFDFSCWYRGGPLSSAVWAVATGFGAKPPTEDDAQQDIVYAARHAGAWVGMPAATSQACFIAKFGPLKKNELIAVAQQVVYLQGHSADRDPLIRISDAIAGWRIAFPNLKVVTMEGRDGRWHLPLVEFPRETVQAMIATRH